MGNSPQSRANQNEKRKLERAARREAKVLGVKLIPPTLPSDEPSAEQLIEVLKIAYARKEAHELARKLINITVPISGPIGIIHFGDPHVDDDGTDWAALERDIRLVQSTPGLYAANIGDTTNNWVGRLGHLYGQQSTTAKQAWILAEWFIKQLSGRWLYLIGGNHDAWSGEGDPLRWITSQVGAMYEATEARIGLTWSIERLDEGYGLVETIGETSRTVYLAKTAKDAKRLLQMTEVYDLMHSGAPVEIVRAKRRKA